MINRLQLVKLLNALTESQYEALMRSDLLKVENNYDKLLKYALNVGQYIVFDKTLYWSTEVAIEDGLVLVRIEEVLSGSGTGKWIDVAECNVLGNNHVEELTPISMIFAGECTVDVHAVMKMGGHMYYAYKQDSDTNALVFANFFQYAIH